MGRRGFASDNHAGAHPEILDAVLAANDGHAEAYGDDPWTRRFEAAVRARLGERAQPYLVFTGTAANVLALTTLSRSWEATICAQTAHLHVDEAAAPEVMGRVKLLPVPTTDGKLTPGLVEPLLTRAGDVHAPQPRVVSITQSTELGTVYTVAEIRALTTFCHERGLYCHVDGSRIFNAAVACDATLAEMLTETGVDAVSLGGTKIGLLGAEAAIFLAPDVGATAGFLRKQAMQLASKHRFLAAQMAALLESDLGERAAAHANAMARRLADAVSGLPAVRLTQAPSANAVFAVLPRAATAALQERWAFHVWDETSGEVRWMAAWDTTVDDVDAFAADIARETGATRERDRG